MKIKYVKPSPTPLVGEEPVNVVRGLSPSDFQTRAAELMDDVLPVLAKSLGEPRDAFKTHINTFGIDYVEGTRQIRVYLDQHLRIVVEYSRSDNKGFVEEIVSLDDEEKWATIGRISKLFFSGGFTQLDDEIEFWGLFIESEKDEALRTLPKYEQESALVVYSALKRSRFGVPTRGGVSLQTDPTVVRFEHDHDDYAVIWECVDTSCEAYVLNRKTQDRRAFALTSQFKEQIAQVEQWLSLEPEPEPVQAPKPSEPEPVKPKPQLTPEQKLANLFSGTRLAGLFGDEAPTVKYAAADSPETSDESHSEDADVLEESDNDVGLPVNQAPDAEIQQTLRLEVQVERAADAPEKSDEVQSDAGVQESPDEAMRTALGYQATGAEVGLGAQSGHAPVEKVSDAGVQEKPDTMESEVAPRQSDAEVLKNSDTIPSAPDADIRQTSDERIVAERQPETLQEWFAEYVQSEEYIQLAEEALADCRQHQSGIVKAIFEKFGQGPFPYKGKYVRAIQRGGTSYYFRVVNPKDK